MSESKPIKVRVYESKDKPLGEGELIGKVPMSELMTAEEYTTAMKNFMMTPVLPFLTDEEKKRLEAEVDKEIAEEIRNFPLRTTPKIRLDSGKIVYGCEVWWEPIE